MSQEDGWGRGSQGGGGRSGVDQPEQRDSREDTPTLMPNEVGATGTSSCPQVTCNFGRLMYFRICFDMYL